MQEAYDEQIPRVAHEWILLALILLLGCGIRTVHLVFLPIDFPNKGGGLYVQFAQQIARAGFRIPNTIPFYSDGGIPFAYPPLPFYAEALLTDVFSLSRFLVANLLPPATAILTLLAFSALTKTLRLSFGVRVLAVLAYATMDAAFLDQISPAGLAEAFGSLSVVALTWALVRAHRHGTTGSYAWVGLAWALCVVSSPGSAYASVMMFLVFSIVQLLRTEGTLNTGVLPLLILSGLVAVVASSPYWLPVVGHHGFQIFTSSFGAQHRRLFKLENLEELTEFQIAGDAFVWNIALLAGLVWAVWHHRWPLILWFLAMYSVPREGGWLVAPPAALLIGRGGAEMILSPLIKLAKRIGRRLELAVLVALMVPMIIGPAAIGIVKRVRNSFLPPEAVALMRWARENTPTDGQFLVMVDNPVIEWAPHILQRTVLNVRYGTEFSVDERERISKLNRYMYRCQDVDCLYHSLFSSRTVPESRREWYRQNGVYLLASQEHLTNLSKASTETTLASIRSDGLVTLGLLVPPDYQYLLEFGGGVGVARRSTIPSSLGQGEVLELELEWALKNPPQRDLEARVSLVDESGNLQQSTTEDIVQGDKAPAGWMGVIKTTEHSIQVSPHLPPGRYTVAVALGDAGESKPLARIDIQPLPREFDRPEQMDRALETRLGETIQLLGYDHALEDSALELTLHWQAIQRPSGYYKTFVHVFDPATGTVVAQHDAVPRDWTYPTNWWEAGEVVSDTIVIPIGDAPPGHYQVAVGMYDPDSGERLLVSGATGESRSRDRVILPDEVAW